MERGLMNVCGVGGSVRTSVRLRRRKTEGEEREDD